MYKIRIRSYCSLYLEFVKLYIEKVTLKIKIKKQLVIMHVNLHISEYFMRRFTEMGYYRKSNEIKDDIKKTIEQFNLSYEIDKMPNWQYQFIKFCRKYKIFMFTKSIKHK